MTTAPVKDWKQVATLSGAWRAFFRKRSPWLIAAAIVIAAAARIWLGEIGWRDAVAVGAMLVIYPFGEWAIHVYVLHMKPFVLRGRKIDPAAARGHREHHSAPNDLGLINLEPSEVAQLLLLTDPLVVGFGALIVGLVFGTVPLAVVLSALLTGYVLVGIYEWTHFLIHTAYVPRSRYYRSVWRNHRLHHFKNEHFWHGITTTIGDRVLGTLPDQREIERSPTARNLDQGFAG